MIPVTLWTFAGLAVRRNVWEGTLPAVPAPGHVVRVQSPDGDGEGHTYRVLDVGPESVAPVEWQLGGDGTLIRVWVEVA